MNKYSSDSELKLFIISVLEEQQLDSNQRFSQTADTLPQKQRILDEIVFTIQQSIEQENKQIEDKFDQELLGIRLLIDGFMSKFRHLAEPTKRRGSFHDEVNKITAIEKKIKELDDNFKVKLINIDNLSSLLMDNQITIKKQISDMVKNESALINNEEQLGSTSIEQKMNKQGLEFKNFVEELAQEQKLNMQGKMLFYWKVLDDQIEKIDSVRRDVDLIYEEPKNFYKMQKQKSYLNTE